MTNLIVPFRFKTAQHGCNLNVGAEIQESEDYKNDSVVCYLEDLKNEWQSHILR